MELKQTIECRVRVSAGLEEDGTLTLKAFASSAYAPGATTTAVVEIDDLPLPVATTVKAALREALAAAQPLLGKRIGAAIHKSAEVAAAHGEI